MQIHSRIGFGSRAGFAKSMMSNKKHHQSHKKHQNPEIELHSPNNNNNNNNCDTTTSSKRQP